MDTKGIRRKLRLAMNGVVSTSMREKGVQYKLNFGVSLPKIKEIASDYTKDSTLANDLWLEDVREMKIMATLLQPIDCFTREQARQWAASIHQQEIAEQFCINLLQNTPFAEELAIEWIDSQEEWPSVIGFTLLAHLCIKGHAPHPSHSALFMQKARQILDEGISRKQRAALLALKRYGRLSVENAEAVLCLLSDFSASDSTEKREFYADLRFELDYYSEEGEDVK